jgi:hypothetical protein
MLNAAKGRRCREGPLVEINNAKELEAWLRKQPREVAFAFAAHAALRVLPVVQLEKRETYIRDLVLPVFRATAISWAAAKYPAREKKLATACRTAAALVAQSTGSTWGSGYAAAASRAAEYAAVVTIRDTASADAANAAVAAVDALAAFGAGLSLGFNLDATAFGANPVVDAFWAAVSIDATGVEEGVAASVIAGSPLWPLHPIGPEPLASLWQDMKAALRAEKQDWQVWTIWYDDRLAGYPFREEERELAYVRIDEPLWAKGPAVVNAEIRKRIEELEPPPRVVEVSASGMAGGTGRASLSVAEPAISAVPVDNPPITGAAAQHLSEISAGWQSADAALQTPRPGRRQYVPDVLVNPVAPADTPPVPIEAIPDLPLPEIPPQRPAALEPVWSNGKLILPPRPATTDGDKRANAAALKALRAELIELADDVEAEPSNFDKRAATYFRRIAERIPDRTPPQHELFRLAHAKEVLEGHGSTINGQWPDHLAPRFHALTLLFDRVVRQFPKWREFVRNAQEDRLTAEQVAEVPAISVMVLSALREEDAKQFIDREIPEALEQLQQPPQAIAPNDSAQPLVLEDVVESINNIVKEAVAAALDERAKTKADPKPRPSREKVAKGFGHVAKEAATGYRDEAQKSFVKEAKRLGKETGPAITQWRR